MVCRNRKISSVITTFARDMSGLEDNQVLGLYHALMREEGARNADARPEGLALRDQHLAFLNQMEQDHAAGRLAMSAGSRHPAARFRAARTEEPDAARVYAAQHIVARAQRSANAQREFLHQYARELGVPVNHAAMEYHMAFADASENARYQPSPAFARAWRNNPDHADLPVDRRSVYAFEQMEIARAARNMAGETRPAVTREPIDSSFIQEVGFDPLNGRMEMVMTSNPNRVYAYRMTESEYADFRNASSQGSYYSRNIRGNDQFHYRTADEAAEGAVHRRCATCGQFTGTAHACAITGSEEDINRDIRLAVQRSRQQAAGIPITNEAPQPRLELRGTTRYPAEDSVLRMAGISRIRQEARRHTNTDVQVAAVFPADGATVSGNVNVEYNGYGNGYDVEAVTEPGDSGTRNLRCTCARYRASYSCEHVDAVTQQVRDLAVDSRRPQPAAVRQATDDVTVDLAENHALAEVLTEQQQEGWRQVETSLVNNPEAFQELYEEARAERRAYREAVDSGVDAKDLSYPVAYVKEAGALGGLCTRESEQGFGIELEYSYPPDWTSTQVSNANAVIARELYGDGLTDTDYQQDYGASHGREPRFEHARGWSFEQDYSTGEMYGSGVRRGGEVVSPVMYDEADTWTNIEKVSDVIKRNGGIPSRSAGMHIHVGTGSYDHGTEKFNRLLSSVAENEDLMYRMYSNPEDKAHRVVNNGFCRPNSFPSSPYTTVGDMRSGHQGHHLALNMESVSGRPSDHVEFRVGDSTLTPGVIQSQILMSAGMVDAGSRETGNPRPNQNRQPLGTHLTANPSRAALTGEDWTKQTEPIRKFIDRFVSGGTDGGATRTKQLVSLFAMTRWHKASRY